VKRERHRYVVALSAGEDGRVSVTMPQLPEVATFGSDEAHALKMAADAVYAAVSARLTLGLDVPPGDAGAADELAVAIDVPPKRRGASALHHAALNTATLVVFPGVDEFLPEPILLRIFRRLRMEPERIRELFGFDDEEMETLLAALAVDKLCG
jgi:predicted RNase H-like HicB family nuclease